MKIMIAGLGSIGRRHLRNLVALGETDILLFRTKKSSLPEEELQGFPVETDLQAALAHHPQAVVISNPTANHLDVAIPAARAGCSILLEKPISHTMQAVDQLEKALQAGGGQLLVGYHYRFHPNLRRAVDILSSGELGNPLSFHCHWGEYLPGWHPWEDYRQAYSARPELGGGVVLTLSHPLDYLRWMLGEVEAVWAFTTSNGLNLEVEDNAEIGLRFAPGVIGSLHLDYNQRPGRHNLEVITTQGCLRWDNADGGLAVHRAGSPGWETIPAPPGFERNQMFMDEMRHFLAVARGEARPVCTLQDGTMALRLALAALQSAREQRMLKLESR